MNTLVEICCGHFISALVASHCEVDRIELCSAIEVGGITPDFETFKLLKSKTAVPIAVLIRPREGHFYYNNHEKLLIQRQIEWFCAHEVDAIVMGALTSQNELDVKFLEKIMIQSGEIPLVFHRAFDFVKKPINAMEELIDLGFERILSSGKQATAWKGRHLLKELIHLAKNRISIMPGAGINAKNIINLLKFTGAKEVHFSAKQISNLNMSAPPFPIEYYNTDSKLIEEIMTKIREL